MIIDVKLVNEILTNQSEEQVKKIIQFTHPRDTGMVLGKYNYFMNILKNSNHRMDHLISCRKGLFQHLFMIKVLERLGIKWTNLNIILFIANL